MKKFLSLALAAIMLLSSMVVLAVPAAAAGEGDWAVIPPAQELQPDFEDDPASLAGYKYTNDGFTTVPTEAWANVTPNVSIQRKEMVDLKQGVYIEIRIDKFTYLGDKWFNFHIWDKKGIAPGYGEEKYGSGIQTLIRPSDSPDEKDKTVPGTVKNVTWWYKNFQSAGTSSAKAEQNLTTESGQPILAMTVSWDAANNTYVLDINGAAAPQNIITNMNEKWGGENSMAYIGFNFQNANVGGAAECTITKFGTTKENATVPTGTDNVAPVNNFVPIAPLADPSTISANAPAVLLTADKETSDTKGKPAASNGATGEINADGSYHAVGTSGSFTAVSYTVKNNVSYSVTDFPIIVVMVRNYCDCVNALGNCYATEKTRVYVPCGQYIQPDEHSVVADMPMADKGYVDAEGNLYRYFTIDVYKNMKYRPEGRINMVRFDTLTARLEQGKKEFDVMFAAFFRSEEEAAEYIKNYATTNQLTDYVPKQDETPKQTTGTTTVKQPPKQTQAQQTVAQQPVAGTTAAPAGSTEKKSGCGSTIASGAVVITAIAGLGIGFVRRKRRQ